MEALDLQFSHTRATTAKARPADACVENEQLLLGSTPVLIIGYADPILRVHQGGA
jgi:hypothetical protein